MPSPLEKPLQRAISILETHRYRYAVIGGIANQFWGIVRLTHDVDIKVLVPNTDYSAAKSVIRSAFPKRGRPHAPVEPLIVDVKIGNIVVDFLLAAPGYEENVFRRAVRRNFGNLAIWICSAEDLIVQKGIANRGKDWQDIDGILARQNNRLDIDYIENWLAEFAQVLEQPEILERYREARNRVRKIISKKKKRPEG